MEINMFAISIPGFGDLNLKAAIIDYNGTLAFDGKLIKGIAEPLNALSELLEIHIVTGDGFGTAKDELSGINCTLTIIPPENQGLSKQKYLRQLNPKTTVSIGNGKNDSYILKESALGIAIIGEEGIAVEAILSANIILPSITRALELFHNPRRLKASLRY
jgi:soluble P-type ATPase